MYTIGDFLIRIKNAYMAHKRSVTIPFSKVAASIGKILADERYIKSVKESEIEGKKMLTLELLYRSSRPALRDVSLVSRPSVHVYVDKNKLKKNVHNFGIGIVSTSQGIMSDKTAVARGIGGELICRIS